MISSFYRRLLLCSSLSLALSPALLAQEPQAQYIQISWKPTAQYNGTDNLDYAIVLKNNAPQKIVLKDWELWFNAMFPALNKQYATHKVIDNTGNLFQVQFQVDELAPQDSLVINYTSKYKVVNFATAPNGFYLQHAKAKDKVVSLADVHYTAVARPLSEERAFYENLYTRNAAYLQQNTIQQILPTPANIQVGKKKYTLAAQPTLTIDDRLADQAIHFQQLLGARVTGTKNADVRVVYNAQLGKEAYTLTINQSGIQIGASSSVGAFYALQSIRSLLTKAQLASTATKQLPYVVVSDEPRYGYRGFMLDISRNFKDKSTILKYLDMMAAYKLNVFHFHFTDDEGWRIEIPGLPELTEVGATRSPGYADGQSIAPAYGSGARHTKGEYLRKADFVEILKYAKDRHITVVPELESPGHGRAAVKAMEERYHRYVKMGNRVEAERYLLHDFEDRSIYNSAQNWTDNVMNPALPSVYTFVEKVVDEFAAMYKEAGLTLEKVSLGGDEVPNGVWEGSPKIQALMQREGLKSVHEVWPYYVNKLNAICLAKGLKMAGWEEFGMVNQGNGMRENPALPNKSNIQLDVWNNMIGGGQEDLAYRLANAGYPTVLISASNLYFDMMWNDNFAEPGLKWATMADLHHAYSLLPEAFFANIDTYYSGKKLGKAHFEKHVRLTEKGKSNFLGIKGGLWAETVHTESALDYMVFPRFFALAERAWSAKRAYESEQTFDSKKLDADYSAFLYKVGTKELPKWNTTVQYRLPAVGLKEKDGKVWANLEYPGFKIYYSTDGSTPSVSSPQYNSQKPIAIAAGQRLAFAVIDAQGRVGQVSYITK